MEQVRLAELLTDPVYRQWFEKSPETEDPPPLPNGTKRWAVWYQEERDGPWQLKRFGKYTKAKKWIFQTLPWLWDAAIVDLPRAHKPPLLKQKTGKLHRVTRAPLYRRFYWPFPAVVDETVTSYGVGHYWCPYCRRPTVFKFFTSHHAFPNRRTIGWDLRCTICGVRRKFIRDYYRKWGGH